MKKKIEDDMQSADDELIELIKSETKIMLVKNKHWANKTFTH